MRQDVFDMFYNDFKHLDFLLSKINAIPSSDIIMQNNISSIENGDELTNPFQCLVDHIGYTKKVIDKLKAYNPALVSQYLFEFENYTNKAPTSPEICILFKKLVNCVKEEKYKEAAVIKNTIINNF